MINLIPPEIKENQKAASRIYSFISLYIIIVAALVLSAAGLSTYNFVKAAYNTSIQGDIDNLISQQKKQGDTASKAAYISDRIKVSGQYKEDIAWDQVLQKVADNTPTGVQLSSIKTVRDSKTITITLGGISSDRRTPVLFADKLSKAAEFANVTLQSIGDGGADGNSFTFAIALNLKDGSLKLETTK
jgi:Tfp pilus assembly protein PilN